jgi:hypothetical protein
VEYFHDFSPNDVLFLPHAAPFSKGEKHAMSSAFRMNRASELTARDTPAELRHIQSRNIHLTSREMRATMGLSCEQSDGRRRFRIRSFEMNARQTNATDHGTATGSGGSALGRALERQMCLPQPNLP